MKPSIQLSELQLAVLRVIWDEGEATVARVHEELLPTRGLATTTVATVLTRLEKRGVLNHRREGRQFVYQALVTEEEARRSMVAEITHRVFQGDPAMLVNALFDSGVIKNGDRARVLKAVETKANVQCA